MAKAWIEWEEDDRWDLDTYEIYLSYFDDEPVESEDLIHPLGFRVPKEHSKKDRFGAVI